MSYLVRILTVGLVVGTLSACSLIRPYRMDISQGNPLTADQVAQIKIGMTPEQVSYYLGTPSVQDPTEPNAWYYVYRFIPGTYGRKYHIPAVKNQQLKIVFDSNSGNVAQITGVESFPVIQKMVPSYSSITGRSLR